MTPAQGGLERVLALFEIDVAIVDERGRFVLVNNAFAKTFGWSSDQLAGREFAELVSDPTRPAGAPDPGFAPDKFGAESVTVRCGDGTIRRATLKSAPVQLNGAKPMSVVMFHDSESDLAAGSAQPGAAGGARSDSEMRAALVRVVERQSGVISAGRLQFVGLDGIRAELGATWDRLADRVGTIAEGILKRRLAPEDTFHRNAQGEFVILFARLDDAEAAFKAEAIANEIRQTLIGDHESGRLEGVSADHLVAATRLEVETQALEFAPQEAESAEDVAGLVLEKLRKARERARAGAHSLFREIRDLARLRPCKVLNRHGLPTAIEVALFDATTEARVARLKRVTDEPTAAVAELDLMRLGLALEYLYDRLSARESLILVRLSYGTLSVRRHRDSYLSICRTIGDSTKPSLGFLVESLPRDVSSQRLAEFTSTLGPFARVMAAAWSARDPTAARELPAAGVIALDFNEIEPWLALDTSRIRRLLDRLHANRSRALVENVGTPAAAEALQRLGVDLFTLRPTPA